MLAIELDGGQHFTEGVLANDHHKTIFLQARGYRVLRFSNLDVLTNIDGVIDAIRQSVESGSGRSRVSSSLPPNPSPRPSPRYGGERETLRYLMRCADQTFVDKTHDLDIQPRHI